MSEAVVPFHLFSLVSRRADVNCPGNATVPSARSGLLFLLLPAASSLPLPAFVFLSFHSVNGKAREALLVAHRFLEYLFSTVTLN